jgi:hypothetical protein
MCGRCAAIFAEWRASSSKAPDPGWTNWYKDHYNSKLNACFVLVFAHQWESDFLFIDLFDANEHKHYGEFDGHSVCTLYETRKCQADHGSIWLRGDDLGTPDMHFFFKGIEDEPKNDFMHAVRPFMTE